MYNILICDDEKDIVSHTDLMTLKNTGEAIIITPYGYIRIDKCPWYMDKIFKPIVEKNIQINKQFTQGGNIL